MTGAILTLNAGSSSLKFAVFAWSDPGAGPEFVGNIAGIGRQPAFKAKDAAGAPLDAGALAALPSDADHAAIIAELLPWIDRQLGDRELVVVGHRVVHGGRSYAAPTRITPKVLAELDTLVSLAPLHQPVNLAAIRAVAGWHADLPQVACFDTGFHQTQDRLAKLFALPRALTEEGILRYGFHGLSYDYIASILPAHLGPAATGRVIVAHLGNGASLCAMKNGKSVATSMGFTALDGLVMGRRCGALDPGVVLHLMREKGMTADEIEHLLYNESGLYGVSGVSNNMEVLLNSPDPNAKEAVDLFCYRAASVLAGLIPGIGGLDALVFTAGIGENAPPVRKAICERLDWLGVRISEDRNAANEIRISAPDSSVGVFVLPTNEEAVVATACRTLLAG